MTLSTASGAMALKAPGELPLMTQGSRMLPGYPTMKSRPDVYLAAVFHGPDVEYNLAWLPSRDPFPEDMPGNIQGRESCY